MPDPIRGLVHRVRDAVSRHRPAGLVGLQVAKDPKDAEIDIIAIHGLGDKGFRSWTTRDAKSSSCKPWLEELLAGDVPKARIMQYAYQVPDIDYASVISTVLYDRALNLAQSIVSKRRRDGTTGRPLFFIAHSLGGWIVKRTLIMSNESADPQLRDIEISTCGVAFFGTMTPGKPASPSPLVHVIRRTTSRDTAESNKSVDSILELTDMGSEWQERQLEAFKGIAANLPTIAFYETRKTQESFIVEQRHTMKGSDGSQIGLSSTHSDLVKFHGRDENYNAFITKFKQMTDKNTITSLLESKRKVFESSHSNINNHRKMGFAVPYEIPDDQEVVIIREELLEQLREALDPDTTDLAFRIATLIGATGSGKTNLAKSYAQTHAELSFIFWIRAESWETVIASYLEFADRLVSYYATDKLRSKVEEDFGLTGIQDMIKAKSVMLLDQSRSLSVVQAINDWLSQPGNDNWLLVFDHVVGSYDVHQFIPLTLSGRVLLTSTNSNICSWGVQIKVGQMTEEQAVELLTVTTSRHSPNASFATVAYRPENTVNAELESAKAIAKSLDYHPQSLSNAASVIRNKDLDISDYFERLKYNNAPQLFGSTIDQSPFTKRILRVSAMLSNAAIPVSIFNVQWAVDEASARFQAVLKEIQALQAHDSLGDVLQHLINANFIQSTASPDSSPPSSPPSSRSSRASTAFDYFIIDDAAREHVRGSLSDDERVEHAWLACNVCVNGIRENDVDSATLREVHNFGRIMLPHAKTCYDDWSDILDVSKDEDVAWHVLGNVCMTQGATEQAIGCFELALRQDSDITTFDRIQTSLALAQLLERKGENARSLQILTSINIGSIDQALGFRVAFAKASATAACGNLDRAEDQYETLEHEQEEHLGPTHAETVGTVQMLAATLARLGKTVEAQALYKRAFLSYQNTFGQGHPMTLGSLDDLAGICRETNAIDFAETLYQQSIDIKTRWLGADHPRTAFAIQNIAWIDDIKGRHADAKAKYEKALEIMLPAIGRAHPHYTMTLENLARSRYLHAIALGGQTPMTSSLGAEDFHRRVNGLAGRLPGGKDTLMRESARRRAIFEAEKLYLEAITIKKSAKDIYSHVELRETVSTLNHLYEDEDIFALHRLEKMQALAAIMEANRRRGTV